MTDRDFLGPASSPSATSPGFLPRLPAAAEALLRQPPVLGPEPDWEARVEAIVAAASAPSEGGVDPAWFSAPALPPEPGEPVLAAGGSPTATPGAGTSSTSLKELALRHVAAEEERQAAERAAAMRPLLAPTPAATAAPEARAAHAPTPDVAAGERAAAAPGPAPRDDLAARRQQRSAALAGLGVLAAAAAVFLLVSPARNQTPPELAAAPRPVNAPVLRAPTGTAAPTAELGPALGPPRGGGAAGGPAAVALGGPRAGARAAPAPVALLPAPGASAPDQPPEEPPLIPGMRPADGSETRPLQPPAGAMHAAFESAMPAARACLVMHEGPAQASVVFASDGSVRSVVVAGPVGATAEGECVRQALSRARVAPFEKAEYRTTVTVRP